MRWVVVVVGARGREVEDEEEESWGIRAALKGSLVVLVVAGGVIPAGMADVERGVDENCR